jgi:hypothetical protein
MIGKGNAGLSGSGEGQDRDVIAVAQVAHYFCSSGVVGSGGLQTAKEQLLWPGFELVRSTDVYFSFGKSERSGVVDRPAPSI